jgi:ABC-type phosphate/phosphonate transport system substrate-binding protein
MKMADGIDFKVSEGLIRPIIESKINAAIVEAMGGHERMIAEMIASFLNQNVDSEGKASGYSSSKPRLSWLVHKMLEDAMQKALTEFLLKKKGLLEKEFEKFFASKAGSSKVVAAMQDGFCTALKDKWRTTITFQPPN